MEGKKFFVFVIGKIKEKELEEKRRNRKRNNMVNKIITTIMKSLPRKFFFVFQVKSEKIERKKKLNF